MCLDSPSLARRIAPQQTSAGRGRSRGPTPSRTPPRPWQAWQGQAHRGGTARAPCAPPPAFGAPAEQYVARGQRHSAVRRKPGGPPAIARLAPRGAVASGGAHRRGARRLAATHRNNGQLCRRQSRCQAGRKVARHVTAGACRPVARLSARRSTTVVTPAASAISRLTAGQVFGRPTPGPLRRGTGTHPGAPTAHGAA